jgi:hypothetical protein
MNEPVHQLAKVTETVTKAFSHWEGGMLANLIASILLLLPNPTPDPAAGIDLVFDKPQRDGSRYIKAKFEGDTFLIKTSSARIVIDRREKVGRVNTRSDQRDRMRRLALAITGCKLENEFFSMWQFALEADLLCSDRGNAALIPKKER